MQNGAAAIVLLLLFVCGWLLIAHLRQSLETEACIEAGFRNCAQINP